MQSQPKCKQIKIYKNGTKIFFFFKKIIFIFEGCTEALCSYTECNPCVAKLNQLKKM